MSTAAANNSGLAEEQIQVSKLLEFARQHCSQHNYRAAINAIQAGLALARGDECPRAPDEMLAQLYATLANAQMVLGQAEVASVNYKAALRLSPHLAGCWCNLGAAYMQQGKADAAVAYFLQAIELSPGHWPSRTNLVQALMATWQYPIAKTLLLELIDERPEDGQLHHDLVVAANSLVGRLGSSIINHPRSVLRTTRDVASQMFNGIPACRVPKTFRLMGDGDLSRSLPQIMSGLSFPVLVRPAGTHGGDRFEKVGDIATLVGLIEERSELDHYLIDYIDYRSVDGYFRKYRFVFVAGEIFPYHLAIGTDWKLHRDSCDMRDQSWMREEEAVFLSCPGRFFEGYHLEALKTIGDRIGLEYCGVDCGLDALGNLVVFEVNASVLVHGEEGELAYKDPFARRIREAFDAMLARHAAARI